MTITLRPLVFGLVNPVYVTHAGDGSDRLFILEQAGRVRIYRNRSLLSNPFLDIRNRVDSGNEKGLLGLAFHPDFKNNGRFFVNYTRRDAGQLKTVIAEYQVSAADPNLADPRERTLFEFEQPFANHNGGQIDFGADGYLYIGTGDGGSGGDPLGNGQNKNSLLGKMLRIDVDRGSPYAVPPDNPFVGQPDVREEIWAYGLRNPWRFSFDRSGGRLFAGDVGQNSWEEVDILVKGGNYGWNVMEGAHCFSVENCDRSGLILPVSEYGRSEGRSVIGGYVYRGRQSTSARGAFIFGDFRSGRIWSLEEVSSGAWKRSELLQAAFLISSFGEDEDGEIYVVDYSGAVLQIEFGSRQFFAQVGDGVSEVGVFQSSLIVTNNGQDEVSGEWRLYSSSGLPLFVTIEEVTASRFPFVLEGKSSSVFVTDGTSDPVATGWAELISLRKISGAVLYRLATSSGEPISEAGLEASQKSEEFTAYVHRRAVLDISTGVAVANPSEREMAQVLFTVKGQEGQMVGRSEITLGPRQQTARFIEELVELGSNFDGTLTIASDQPVIATLLRTKGSVHFSSIPVAN